MSTVLDLDGRQVLPVAEVDRSNVSTWVAHLCCDADLRVKYPDYLEVAALLRVVALNVPDQGSGVNS